MVSFVYFIFSVFPFPFIIRSGILLQNYSDSNEKKRKGGGESAILNFIFNNQSVFVRSSPKKVGFRREKRPSDDPSHVVGDSAERVAGQTRRVGDSFYRIGDLANRYGDPTKRYGE